ncbi:MAG: class I SAM-dependent methyltransferase [Anaerolineae bacterium]
MSKETLFEIDKDLFRERLNKYTRRAFQMLPELDKPRILDIGCGSGVPTMGLARLSNGQIIGLDIDQSLLDKLMRKIEEAGLSDRVKTLKCSMFELDFPDESFDIIWAEGSISRIGFKKGLKEWRRFLKPNGFLVVHDETKNVTKKREQISSCGYDLLGHFTLPRDTWWTEYYGPLEKRINELRAKHSDEPQALLELDKEQREIDMFKANSRRYSSVFFVMQKR